ncbi:DUF1592 domain-containing protein [Rhodopirellula bahusiensis]|uniref:Filamin n=1 Tax=Rhodopirellula bahusiensis TaxID=2014065 RepID=A0A2G1WCH5_9BACT|nr:DUF1592 domain-containing protein [Rhodopirellula bahusiensis]PHQ36701.1 hypothetical protein CEE69_04960 [Rhodopirellula bahusiensis]
MTNRQPPFLAVYLSLASLWVSTAAKGEFPSVEMKALVQTTCIGCHDSGTDTSLDFDSLGSDLNDEASFRMWVRVLDRTRSGEMPPPSESRPDADALSAATESLHASLNAASLVSQRRSGRVPARRLTKRQYGYVLQDLLGIPADVTASLPDESESGSFDTVGTSQRLSAIHMEGFLRAADEALHHSLQLVAPSKVDITFDLEGNAFLNEFHEKPVQLGGNVSRRLNQGVALFRDSDYLIQSGILGLAIQQSGMYRIEPCLEAFQSKGPVTYKIIAKQPSGGATIIAADDLLPGEPITLSIETFLQPGDLVYITVESDDAAIASLYVLGSKNFQGPGLAIRSWKMSGPIHDVWPPTGTRQLLGDVLAIPDADDEAPRIELSADPSEHVKEIVESFATNAFARPIQPGELDRFIALAQSAIDEDRDFTEVIRVPLRSLLSSPQFLLFDESAGELNDHALAKRLSAFLWLSIPDAELTKLADAGKLSDDDVLKTQVERMLADPKAERFINDFLGQWLMLDQVNATSPDEDLYPEYDEILGMSLVGETRAFFTELLNANLPLTNLIDSEFTFVNRRLASHYQIAEVAGQHMRKVSLPEGSHRGGVLTQAAVLKTTANGTVTSPVTRGNFVLTNLLGTPASSPPPGVGSIEPDTRGKTTIREILTAHRDNESCNACHRKIDPPGFALECFDPIGSYRTHYRATGAGEGFFAKLSGKSFHQGPPADASGATADGVDFSGIDEFKQALMNQKEQVARQFVSQLVVYSTGGEIQFADRDVIEGILRANESQDYPARDLLHAVIQSRLFREK